MRHLVIVGRTGFGKSSLARWLLHLSPRAIVLDILRKDFSEGIIFYSYAEAAEYYLLNWDKTFRIICRFSSDEEWEAILKLAYFVQEKAAHEFEQKERESMPRPLALIIEEASEFTNSYSVPEWFLKLWKYGRHWNIHAVAVAQFETMLNNKVRGNSDLVFFRSPLASSETLRQMPKDWPDRLVKLSEFIHDPSYERRPVDGEHYLTAPDIGDVLDKWTATLSA